MCSALPSGIDLPPGEAPRRVENGPVVAHWYATTPRSSRKIYQESAGWREITIIHQFCHRRFWLAVLACRAGTQREDALPVC